MAKSPYAELRAIMNRCCTLAENAEASSLEALKRVDKIMEKIDRLRRDTNSKLETIRMQVEGLLSDRLDDTDV